MIPDKQKGRHTETGYAPGGHLPVVSFVNDADGNPIYENTYGIPSWRKNGKGNGEQNHYKEQVLPQFYAQEDGIVDWFDAIRIHYNKH